MLLLVPSDPLNERRPDEYFEGDAEAARGLAWAVSTIDHDALAVGDAVRAVRTGAGNER